MEISVEGKNVGIYGLGKPAMSFGEGIRFQGSMILYTIFHFGKRNDVWLKTGWKYMTDSSMVKTGIARDLFNGIL